MYFAKHITNGRCVDDIMYINLSLFESDQIQCCVVCFRQVN